jgi:hypothetical protein
MRATFAWSPSETIALLPSFRFNFGDFDERMCRVFVWPRLILPVPVLLKRLAAPEWVFNLGIFFSFTWFWRSNCSPRVDRGFPHLFRLFQVYRNRASGPIACQLASSFRQKVRKPAFRPVAGRFPAPEVDLASWDQIAGIPISPEDHASACDQCHFSSGATNMGGLHRSTKNSPIPPRLPFAAKSTPAPENLFAA